MLFECLLPVHVDDIKGTARKDVADPLLSHLNRSVGQCKAGYGSFLHTGIQHEHRPGEVFTNQHVYTGSVAPTEARLFIGKVDDALCCQVFHESYRSVFGAVVWAVFTRADLAAYAQALQRRAHAPCVEDCKIIKVVIRNMERHKCGLG